MQLIIEIIIKSLSFVFLKENFECLFNIRFECCSIECVETYFSSSPSCYLASKLRMIIKSLKFFAILVT